MKVSEMEAIIQQITELICTQLPQPAHTLAVEKSDLPPEVYTRFPDVCWQVQDNEHADGMIVKQVTIPQISSLASLQEKDELTRRILAFLLQGKPVLVLEGVPVGSKKPSMKFRMKQTIQEYINICQQFGMYFYQSPQDYTDFLKECQKKVLPTALPKRTFITEKQVKKLIEQRVPLRENLRLTPLAADYARQYRSED